MPTWIAYVNGEKTFISGAKPNVPGAIQIPAGEREDWLDLVAGQVVIDQTKKTAALAAQASTDTALAAAQKKVTDARARLTAASLDVPLTLTDVANILKDIKIVLGV